MALKTAVRTIKKERHKRYLLRRLLTSFMVTSGVVAAFVIFKPTPAMARFIDVRAFGNNIYYEVYVFDEDDVIREGSLKIVAENPLESHSISLEVGVQSGVFEGLSLNTEYRIAVKANEGFGEKTLTATKMMTSSGLGGVVASYRIIHAEDYMVTYELTTSLYDPYNDIAEAFLTVYHDYEYAQEIEPIAVFFVATGNQSHTLETIGEEGGDLILVLEAVLHSEERVILDQKTIKVPSPIYASLYPIDVTANAIYLSVYLDQFHESLTYELYLYEGTTKKQTIMLTSLELIVPLTHLKESTVYRVELWAFGIDSMTLKKTQTMVRTLDIKTTQAYQIIYELSADSQSIRVRIELEDPHDVIVQMRIQYFTIDEGIEYYQGTYNVTFDVIENIKEAEIFMPNLGPYVLRFYADKQADEDFFYPWTEIHKIQNEEETNHG